MDNKTSSNKKVKISKQNTNNENSISRFLTRNSIEYINESDESFSSSIRGNKFTNSFGNRLSFDESDFEIKTTKTFRVNDFKSFNLYNPKHKNQRKSAVFPEGTKLISLINFQKHQNNEKRKENINPKINYITYEDTFLDNEVFIPSPSSFPGDYSDNSKLMQDFSDDYNDIYYDEINIMNNSFSYKTKKEDNNIYLKLTQMKEIDNSIDLNIKNIKDPLFVDEKEIKGKNIEFLKGKNENLEINNYTHIKDKNNLSNISLNLFVKKIAKDNFRTKYSFLYKSFLEQFSIFLSANVIIEKIINAFYYYKKESSIEYPELINLLNNIVSKTYNTIKTNSEIITKLKNFYNEIKKASWLKDYLKEDTLNVNYILTNEGEEFDLNFTKYSISNRKKNVIFIRENAVPKKNTKNKKPIKKGNEKNSIPPVIKKSYFYIFDYTEEEIAISLTSICYKLISNINIEELLNSNFTKKDKNVRSPNVMKVIERFDKLGLFIIEDICSYDEPKKRAEAITKWVKIAEQCKNLYNFNDVLVINTCFSNYLMRRIVMTWKKIPKSTIKSMNELRKFCSNNQCYLNMRKEIVNRRGRFYIPYLGILLKELVNLEEKYKYVLENGNINCLKVQKLYISINQFFSFKNSPFVKATLNDLDIFAHLNPKSEDQLEMMISKIEPKLIISAGENKKRKTKTDVRYYF